MPIISTLFNTTNLDLLSSLGTVTVLLASFIVYKAYIYPNFLSPTRHIPGPPNKSKHNKYNIPFLGHFLEILKDEAGIPQIEWVEKYGGIISYRSFLNSPRVFVADPKAIQHVLNTHSYKYPKNPRAVRVLSQILGEHGVLLVEGDVHKRQRKLLNPAFSVKHIKEMVPIMATPAELLAKQWLARVDQSESKSVEFDVTTDLGRATLDIIGTAGFGYNFNSLTEPDSELTKAYQELFDSGASLPQLLRAFIPYFNLLPTASNIKRQKAINTINNVTSNLIKEKRAEARAAAEADSLKSGTKEENLQSRDLMSILIRSNESAEDSDETRMNELELKDQIMTFLAAGHETTSVTVLWMLHVLSINPIIQTRVRDELLSEFGSPRPENVPSYDALNGLPYLSACVKELLRYIPPVPITSRMAGEDDTILGYDIPKGTPIFIAPATLHKLKSVWGEDVDEFKPERWIDPTAMADGNKTQTKFVTPDMMWAYQPFLSGPRNCIGSKFALIESKILLYYILTQLEVNPVPDFKFKKAARITTRASPGMNLIFKRYNGDLTANEE
ncbi:hypothetical protein BGZ76_001672 [Entomortierella beljakovae]|nr:hypothetical protein BGZ76_001672 [Entomortierella beljakovae]